MSVGFNDLEKRIIELSFRHKLTHVSSCLNCVNLIDDIYDNRKPEEPFILGSGHASLAHYVILEKHGMCDAEEMIKKHGVHSSRDMEHGIWCSNGSLGQAETVAVGFALADKNRKVWLVTSDGATMEGSTYEAMRFASRYCPNLSIHVVFNGLGAYGEIRHGDLPIEANIYYVNQGRYPEFLRGLAGHYLVLSQAQRDELMQ
jgi:transketolase